MSQLLSPSQTLVDSIPLGRRISEIMHEKGAAYSISAMAKRLDVNRETYRMMLIGKREIYTFELEKIAKDLKMCVERILQTDIVEKRRQLDKMIAGLTELPIALELSKELLESAIGLTETCISLNRFGVCSYLNSSFDQALEVWLQAWPLVKECYEKYDEVEWMKRVACNLMMSYSDNNQHTKFNDIFVYTKPFFEKLPELPSVAYHSLGKFHLLQGNLEEAKTCRLLCLQYSMKTNNHLRTVKFKHNVASMEYRLKNYLTSIEILEEIMEYVNTCSDHFFRSIVHLTYAKNMLRLKKFEAAKHSLQNAFEIMETLVNKGYEEVETELYFLLALTFDDPAYAMRIVHKDKINIQMRKLASKFLIDYFYKTSDQEARETYLTFYKNRHAAIDMLFEDRIFSIDDYLNFFEFCDTIGLNRHTEI